MKTIKFASIINNVTSSLKPIPIYHQKPTTIGNCSAPPDDDNNPLEVVKNPWSHGNKVLKHLNWNNYNNPKSLSNNQIRNPLVRHPRR